MSYNITIPDSVLNAAERLSLKDLLDSPSFQVHLVSALSNSLQNFYKGLDTIDERDEFLMFRLEKIYKSIPHDTRRACSMKLAGCRVSVGKSAKNTCVSGCLAPLLATNLFSPFD